MRCKRHLARSLGEAKARAPGAEPATPPPESRSTASGGQLPATRVRLWLDRAPHPAPRRADQSGTTNSTVGDCDPPWNLGQGDDSTRDRQVGRHRPMVTVPRPPLQQAVARRPSSWTLRVPAPYWRRAPSVPTATSAPGLVPPRASRFWRKGPPSPHPSPLAVRGEPQR